MSLVKLLLEPAILIITGCFVWFVLTVFANYSNVEYNLQKIVKYLQSINKKEVSYKFGHLDEFLSANKYICMVWDDFKKALIFPEKLYLATQGVKNTKEAHSDIYLTIDASYFFNEETLVLSKINHKFIQAMPTLMTGLGPFFTFLKMALAFTAVKFTADVNVAESLGTLISGIRVAALCSVFAVGFSLIFMLIEKTLYNIMCKKYYLLIQREFIRLFDVVTSEKFLMDLVQESKVQNAVNEKILKSLPESIASSFATCFNESAIPYLENILYSLNKTNEILNKGNGGDVVDKLF